MFPLAKASIPEFVYKPQTPTKVKVVSNQPLSSDTFEDVRHIVIDVSGTQFTYVEGQSIGILPPGEKAPGRPHHARLYSIASAGFGEGGKPHLLSICVKRLIAKNPETGELFKGVASNYICDLQPGDEVVAIGASGRRFVIPMEENLDLVLVATGTGIAPVRGFLLKYAQANMGVKTKLFFGVKTKDDLIYANEYNRDLLDFEEKGLVKIETALSREGPTKVYVQHLMEKEKEFLKDIIERGNFAFYICGLKGMEKGIEEVLSNIVGPTWLEQLAEWKKMGRWNVEVY